LNQATLAPPGADQLPSSSRPIRALEAQVESPVLQVTLDGKPLAFTQNGASVTTVAVSSAPADGTVGISFGSEDNRGLSGGQSASNLVISIAGSFIGAAQVAVSPASLPANGSVK
jgi:hypothetical protein